MIAFSISCIAILWAFLSTGTTSPRSEEIYQQTDGYFDPGIGRLIDLWGFGASGGRTEVPKREEIEEAFKNSSIRYLLMEGGRVKKTRNIHINLSAIAKGYAADEIARLIKMSGIRNFLVEIGGEVVASGSNRGDDWIVGVIQKSLFNLFSMG